MKKLVLALCLFALEACGGRVIETGPDGSGGSEVVVTPSAGAGGASGPTTPTGSLPNHDLGDCQPGFERAKAPERQCNWISTAGVCFDTKDLACNCLCPSEHDSVCVSGFYGGPGGATRVLCD